MPLGFAKRKTVQAVSGTAKAGIRAGKAGLSNISVQAGPLIKIRPFDFKRI